MFLHYLVSRDQIELDLAINELSWTVTGACGAADYCDWAESQRRQE
jgi:hypothetical protein